MSLMLYAAMGAATAPPANGPAFDPCAFVFTIRVENDGDEFEWGERYSGVYNATFDWGDGTQDHVDFDWAEYVDGPIPTPSHVYATAGDYNVSVIGTFPAPRSWSGQTWRAMVIAVKQWGNLGGASNWTGSFGHMDHEISVQTPDTFGAGVTDTTTMFVGTLIVGDITGWDVSSVENMTSMFLDSTTFDQDLSGWCVQHIASEPPNFAINTALQPQHYPVWGSCP